MPPFPVPACGISHAPTFGSALRGIASESPNLLHLVYLAPLLPSLQRMSRHTHCPSMIRQTPHRSIS